MIKPLRHSEFDQICFNWLQEWSAVDSYILPSPTSPSFIIALTKRIPNTSQAYWHLSHDVILIGDIDELKEEPITVLDFLDVIGLTETSSSDMAVPLFY